MWELLVGCPVVIYHKRIFPLAGRLLQKQSGKVINKGAFPSQIKLKPSEINLLWGTCQGKCTREFVPFMTSQWQLDWFGHSVSIKEVFKSKHYRGTSKNSFKHSSCFYLAICWFLRLQGWLWNKKLLSSWHCKNTANCITPAVTGVKGLFVIWELPYFGR